MVPWNLSEQLLDMVEQDPRFTVLEPATIIVWLKLIRLMLDNLLARHLKKR